jgi:hypothetical protein
MNAAMRSMAEEAGWAIAILACLLVAACGMAAGCVVAAILTLAALGTDNDGFFNFFFLFGPIGALTGLGLGVLVGSKFIEWGRDSEAHR